MEKIVLVFNFLAFPFLSYRTYIKNYIQGHIKGTSFQKSVSLGNNTDSVYWQKEQGDLVEKLTFSHIPCIQITIHKSHKHL